jgi:integrase/recombinase XerD
MGKLQEQMKADLLLKRYSPHTTRSYLRCIRDFAKYFMRPPAEMGEAEIRQFLLHLTQERKVSPGLQAIYVSALKFLYRTTQRYTHITDRLLSLTRSPLHLIQKLENPRPNSAPK